MTQQTRDRLVVSAVRLPGRRGLFDLDIADGRIAALVPAEKAMPRPGAAPAAATIDGAGWLALPAFVEGHAHLDKTLLGDTWVPHEAGADVRARIRAEKAIRRRHAATRLQRAWGLAERLLGYGSTAIRTHVDIDEDVRLEAFEQMRRLRDEFAGRLDIQLVAFPQSGLRAGPKLIEDLEQALRLGADALGGVDPTDIDGDVDGSLDTMFGLAERHGAGIDLHLHELGEKGAAVIEGICRRIGERAFGGRVVVSHAFCLATIAPARLAALADRMAEAGVAVMTAVPGAALLIPARELAGRGVRVFCGSDNIRDAWAPFGNGDMLDRARLLAYRGDYRDDAGLAFALECATSAGAAALGFAPRALGPGDQADFVLIDSPSVQQAVCDVPAARRVFRKGRIIAQSQTPDRSTNQG